MAYEKKGYPSSRPYMWASGPDPETHAQYRAWVQQRNQAQWRGETWCITFDEFQDIWLGRWHLRGRGSAALAMSRTDWTGPWSRTGVELQTRQQLGRQQAAARARGHRSAARQRELDQIAAAKLAIPAADPELGSAAQNQTVATHCHATESCAKDGNKSLASSNYRPGRRHNQNG
jgi:hypothetical protein